MKRLLAVVLAIALASPAWAVISINDQGAGNQVPVSVNSATEVIAPSGNNLNWTIYPETQDIRCTVGTYSQASGAFTAPAVAPTTTRGFLLKSGGFYNERAMFLSAYTSGPNAVSEDEAKVEVDCASTSGIATSVDTWVEKAR